MSHHTFQVPAQNFWDGNSFVIPGFTPGYGLPLMMQFANRTPSINRPFNRFGNGFGQGIWGQQMFGTGGMNHSIIGGGLRSGGGLFDPSVVRFR